MTTIADGLPPLLPPTGVKLPGAACDELANGASTVIVMMSHAAIADDTVAADATATAADGAALLYCNSATTLAGATAVAADVVLRFCFF